MVRFLGKAWRRWRRGSTRFLSTHRSSFWLLLLLTVSGWRRLLFDPKRRVQHLEKRYFEVGNLGFPVIRAPMGGIEGINMGMLICNDRRWPEAWRVLGLQSATLREILNCGGGPPRES